MQRTAMEKTSHSKDNSKNNCLAVFFAIFTFTTCLKPKKPKKDKQDSKQKKGAGLSGLLPICWVSPSRRAPVLLSPILQVAQWIAVAKSLALLR